MNQYFEFSFLCVSTLFSLINPIGIAPIFLTLTERFSAKEQRKIAKKGIFTGFIILVTFAYLGTYIFSIYSISIDAFRIMGGIIFFRSGLKMLESIAKFPKIIERPIVISDGKGVIGRPPEKILEII